MDSKITRAQYLAWLAHSLHNRLIVRTRISNTNYTYINLRVCSEVLYLGIKQYFRISYYASSFNELPTIDIFYREYSDMKSLKNIIQNDEHFKKSDDILIKQESYALRYIDGFPGNDFAESNHIYPILGHHFIFLGILKMKKVKFTENRIFSSAINTLSERYAKFLTQQYS